MTPDRLLPTSLPPLKGRRDPWFGRIAPIAALALLAACGGKGDLAYAPGQATPPKPVGEAEAPTPAAMLLPPPQAKPDRVDDPVAHSKPREQDRFDLPPPR